ncbi:MAG: HprK-related kinase B [Candidatus Eisenbacteria bacterium]|nr:HprK-related kinase B [Candidatus Eisenbacteria bacterium]
MFFPAPDPAEPLPALQAVADALLADHPPRAVLTLRLEDFGIRVVSNSTAVADRLRTYFHNFIDESATCGMTVRVLETEPFRPPWPFRDWEPEQGKRRLKESYADLPGGRAVRKVRTGMVFLSGGNQRVAVGRCGDHLNQVVNYIVAQYISHRMAQGWILCHAAGIARGDRGLGIAARSGGGKSTLALQLLRHNFDYISNDRLLLLRTAEAVAMGGVPKQPRINPGTALHHPDLVDVLSPGRRAALQRIPASELWELEDKHDADIERLFGPGRFRLMSRLESFVILNWDRRGKGFSAETVDLNRRSDLLPLIQKSPGPFHASDRPPGGSDRRETAPRYVECLASVPVVEITGGVDFPQAIAVCRGLIE